MDNPCFVLHDAQSKAEKNISPAKLEKYIVTLLENHLSEFSQFFDSLTLFVGGVSKTVLQNPELVEFGFHDIEAKAQKSKIALSKNARSEKMALMIICLAKTI